MVHRPALYAEMEGDFESMKRYLLLIAGMVALMLVLFGVVEALGIPLLTEPSASLKRLGGLAAPLGVALLVADVLLPVPSSLVMIAHGALFGVAVGTVLSMIGTVGAGLFGFGLGRKGGRVHHRAHVSAFARSFSLTYGATRA